MTGGWQRPRGDSGVSDVLGVILMVAMSIAMAGAVYLWVFGVGLPGDAPPALGLASAKSTEPGVKVFTVTALPQEMAWGDLAFQLDGKPLAYDDDLAGSRKFCVATGASCLPTASWGTTLVPVAAGHTLYVYDVDITGQTLQVIDTASGTLLLAIRL